MPWRNRRIGGEAAALAAVLVGYLLLRDAQAFARGVSNGLRLCAGVIVPSLFPFMALTQFVCISRVSAVISKPLRPLTKRVLNLPARSGSAVLMSFIGGYPAAAVMIGRMVKSGVLSRRTAGRMLCFCVNAGPSFLIGALGAGMLGSAKAGVLLYASQLLSALVIGFALSFTEKRGADDEPDATEGEAYSRAFVRAVTDSAQAVISMCAFVLIFSSALEFLRGSGLIWAAGDIICRIVPVGRERLAAFFTGIVEVTAGSSAMSSCCSLPGIAFVTSFGSISVMFQISGQLAGSGVPLGGFAASRVLHGAFSAAVCVLLLRLFPEAAVCSAPGKAVLSSASALGSAALLISSAVFLLTLGERTAPKYGAHNSKGVYK